MKDSNQKDHNKVRELSENEIMNVSGGFWGAIIAIAAAALAGCATMPKRHDKD